MDRFSNEIAGAPNVTLKCFNPIPIEAYIEYMDSKLQDKRIPAEYIHRETNKAREKSEECIWKNDTLQEQVLEALLQTDYYKFCHECMGGPDDLLATRD